jgi:hypothetical protein
MKKNQKVNWAFQLGASLTIKLFSGYTTSEDLTKGWRLPSAGHSPELGSSGAGLKVAAGDLS